MTTENLISSDWFYKNSQKIGKEHPAFFSVNMHKPDEIFFSKDRSVFREHIRSLDEVSARNTFIGHTAEIIVGDADDDISASEDPCLSWCMEHSEIFRDHNPSFVAVDLQKGRIVLSDPDEESFNRKFSSFADAERESLFVVHTSVIVD